MSEVSWKKLVVMSIKLLGSTEVFQKHEAHILKRLVKQYGAPEVEKMLAGATLLGWHSLRSLGSAEGLGRRMAIQRYWQDQNKRPAKLPERVKAILRTMGAP